MIDWDFYKMMLEDRLPPEPDKELAEEAEFLKGSYLEFMKASWVQIPAHKGVPLKVEWYHEALAEHIQAHFTGQIPWLMIHMPPRTGKTINCSVLAQSWQWTRNPSSRLLTSSFSDDRCKTDAGLMRDLITSPWYQARWPIKLKKDGNEKGRFDNNLGGYRYTVLYGSAGTGDGGDNQSIDDAQCGADMFSPAKLRHDHKFFHNTWAKRRNNKVEGPSESTMLFTAQRLGPFDLANQVRLDFPNKWQVLSLEGRKTSLSMTTYYRDAGGRIEQISMPSCDTILFRTGRVKDPREVGELLTERLPHSEIDGDPEAAAQVFQRPELVLPGSAMVHRFNQTCVRSFAERMGCHTLAEAVAIARRQRWILKSGWDHGTSAKRECAYLLAYNSQSKELCAIGEYVNQVRTSVEQDAIGFRAVLDRLEIPPNALIASRGDIGNVGKGSDVAVMAQTINFKLQTVVYESGPRKGEKILGFPILTADKAAGSVVAGVDLLNEGFGGGSVFVDPSCSVLIEALQLWKGEAAHKDPVDAFRYAAVDPLREFLYGKAKFTSG